VDCVQTEYMLLPCETIVFHFQLSFAILFYKWRWPGRVSESLHDACNDFESHRTFTWGSLALMFLIFFYHSLS
jgi:hypothetical protein